MRAAGVHVLAVGPAEHGVVRHGLELADAAGAPVLRFADVEELDAALEPAGHDALPDAIHVAFTDALFGGPEEAPRRIRELARGRRVWLGLHDVPQDGEGAERVARRRACYAAVRDAVAGGDHGPAGGIVVNSTHELRCLKAAVEHSPFAHSPRPPHIIPLPVPDLRSSNHTGDSSHDDARGSTSTSTTDAGAPPTIAVFGFLYPGKGVEDVIDAAAAVGRDVEVVNIGGISTGHEHLADELAARATECGVSFRVTGHVPDDDLPAVLAAADVPVIAHRHISASGSLNSWLGAGRRPLAVDGDYVAEVAGRWPGHVHVVTRESLGDAIAAALDDPATTRATEAIAWRWDDVARAHRDAWAAAPTVDVVIPHYDDPAGLRRMLHAVGRQDHPAAAIHVIVADDGSAQPPDAAELSAQLAQDLGAGEGAEVPLPRITVVGQEDRGFRAAAARNLGAAAGTGDMLCFLDCDTVPEPGYLTAMVAGADARTVSVGKRRHAHFPATAAPSAPTSDDPLDGIEPLDDPAWLSDAYRDTDDLAAADDSSFRFIISAVLAVGRELFDAVGGFDATITGYGGEDWDIAWRLWRAGARFRHVPGAVAWHDGPDWAGRSDDPAAAAATKNRETLAVAERITHPLARPAGVVFAMPDVQVHLHRARRWAPGAATATIAACLAAGDCRVVAPGAASPFPADPRVGSAVGSARAEIELLRPIRTVPGGWAAIMAQVERAGHGTIVTDDGSTVARFSTARSRALRHWARRGLADRPAPATLHVDGWGELRGPVRLEGLFAGWD
ncbi:glycosyltransferase [uncultured Corynebacterium sp.]|uniref:glycosyltransferase n=1 Tax=uncultured Corynebacterium sp. TaxID=159447 RepID=UPI0025F9FFD5|nr:glycosyltransferase [uncultured Corynebacterium sp.]